MMKDGDPKMDPVELAERLRRGEIARKMLKYYFGRRGIELRGNGIWRDLGSVAQAIEVPLRELAPFVRQILQELLDETFAE
ncbi:MAG: hypothetical protein HYS89_00255 [Candidatus Colwellbacteria bacterium]|nr:hypothetical protein [Candidatus Colwellbacteria bacterium]